MKPNPFACQKCGYVHAISAPCEKDPEPESMPLNPRHIVFEGPDGSGKTTQIRVLAEALQARNIPFMSLQDPGSSGLGNVIRQYTKAHLLEVSNTEAAFAFHAGRVATMQMVKAALDSGIWVLQDRYFMSTMVYQVLLPEAQFAKLSLAQRRELDFLKSPKVANLLFTYNEVLPQPHLVFCMEGDPNRQRDQQDEKLDAFFADKVIELNRCYAQAFMPILQNGGDVVRISRRLNLKDASDAVMATIKARGYLY